MRIIQNKLKEIRMKEYMLSQREFAEHIGINDKVYGMWERGKSAPNLKVAIEVCEKLNKDVREVWYLE